MFRSVNQFLYQAKPPPTAAELKLIGKCQMGADCEINGGKLPPEGNTNPALQIRAALLRLIISGGTPDCGLHEQGVILRGAHITGELHLNFLTAHGGVRLHHCRFDRKPRLRQARLPELSLNFSHMPGLYAEGIEVVGPLSLKGVRSWDTVDLNHARIGGELSCAEAGFSNRELALPGMSTPDAPPAVDATDKPDKALNVQGMRVEAGFMFHELAHVRGRIDLTSACVNGLVDDMASWDMCQNGLNLDGFTYGRIGGRQSTKLFTGRAAWLEKGARKVKDRAPEGWEFFPQPYTHLAKVLGSMGHVAESRKVLFARDTILFDRAAAHDHRAMALAWAGDPAERGDIGQIWMRLRGRQVWAALSRWIVGYGHKPERALFWAMVMAGLGTMVYSIAFRQGLMVPNSAVIMVSTDWLDAVTHNPTAPTAYWADHSLAAPHYETFFAPIYAVDVLVPIVDLGQESAWAATTTTTIGKFLRYFTFVYQGAGWVITSLGIAAVTGFVQRNSPD